MVAELPIRLRTCHVIDSLPSVDSKARAWIGFGRSSNELFKFTVAEAKSRGRTHGKKNMRRRTFARIGYLSAGDPVSRGYRVQAFRRGLKDLGYIDGENI